MPSKIVVRRPVYAHFFLFFLSRIMRVYQNPVLPQFRTNPMLLDDASKSVSGDRAQVEEGVDLWEPGGRAKYQLRVKSYHATSHLLSF